MSGSFDVIVVGGGPAGSATAISCLKNGLRTLLIEADSIPRQRPGETLHPGVEILFRALDIELQVREAGFVRHDGHCVHRDGQTIFQPYGSDEHGPWLGFQAMRAELDSILLARAADAGAEILRPAKALGPILDGRRVKGLRTSGGAYSALFLVDASGAGHWLQRKLGLPLLEVSRRLIALYGWQESEEFPDPSGRPVFEYCGCGWRWQAPVKPGLCAWVSLDLHGLQQRVPRSARASEVTWRIARPCAGEGYFLVGDAAFVLDPASSHGVLKALMSGMLAASAIAQATKNAGEQSQTGYCALMEKMFCDDAKSLIDRYSQLAPAPSWLASARDAVRYISMRPSA
jgi:flavin-dependent dehydrogenase